MSPELGGGSGVALFAFGAYLLATVAIGLWASTRGKGTEEDYFLAGRGLSALAMALSAVSSGRSAWLVVGASGLAWQAGLSALWVFPGYIAAEALMFVTLGPRLRKRTAEVGAITIPEALEGLALGPDGRTGSSGLPIRQVGAVVICAFLLTYVSAQLGAGATTLGAIFAIDGATGGLLITAGIVLVYTLLGGYRAVVVTDVVQALFMLFGMVVLPLLAVASLGGFGALADALRAIDPELLAWQHGALGLLGGLAIGLGSFGNPHILVRHMSLRDPGEARRAMVFGTTWNVVMAAGALVMGLAGRALYPSTEAMLGEGREYLYATLAQDMSSRYLFAGFVGILLATLFAAIMSTCDSQLLVIASSFVRDFKKRGAARKGIVASRVAVLVTLLAAVSLNYGDISLVNDLVLLSWGALGAALGPAVLALVYDARTSDRGVLAGVLVGAGTVTAAHFLWAQPRGKHIDYELIVAFALSYATIRALRR